MATRKQQLKVDRQHYTPFFSDDKRKKNAFAYTLN